MKAPEQGAPRPSTRRKGKRDTPRGSTWADDYRLAAKLAHECPDLTGREIWDTMMVIRAWFIEGMPPIHDDEP